MNSLEEVVAFVSAKLEECAIPYMIVGSFASNIYGIARATQDADLVVEINVAGIEKLGHALDEEFISLSKAQRKLWGSVSYLIPCTMLPALKLI